MDLLAWSRPGASARTKGWMGLGVMGGVLGLSLLLREGGSLPYACPFHVATGLPCATCGMTRAFVALGHGRWQEALGLNLASPLLFALAWVILALSLLQVLRDRPVLGPLWQRHRRWLVSLVAVVLAVSWGLKLGGFKPGLGRNGDGAPTVQGR